MLEYLKKFNALPEPIRQKVSSKESLRVIEALEREYGVALAALVMKVMVKDVAIGDLTAYLAKENLDSAKAAKLAGELQEKVFANLKDYLTVKPLAVKPAEPPVKPAAAPLSAPKINEEPKVKGASFFFSSDDEEEIRELTKKIETVEAKSSSAGTIDEKLSKITSRAQINFGSAELSDRFSQILRTYLRGIRDRLETKSTLVKPFKSGGLSFDDDSADKIMNLADKINLGGPADEKMAPPPKIRLPEMEDKPAAPVKPVKPMIERDTPYDFSKLAKDKEKIKQDLKKLDTSHELPAPVKTPAIPKVQLEAKPKPKAPADSQMPLIKRRFEAENLNQSSKQKIEDVKYVPKVMGPLDELKYFDLTAFRRLGKEPAETTAKIMDKINLLGEEGYGKKLEAIKAWRSSPANRLYLEIGHLSISGNKPVDVIIEEKKARGEDTLTSGEFEAIMDLNKILRF